MNVETKYIALSGGDVFKKSDLTFSTTNQLNLDNALTLESASILSKLSEIDNWPIRPDSFRSIEVVNGIIRPGGSVLSLADMDSLIISPQKTTGFILLNYDEASHKYFMLKRDKPVFGYALSDTPKKGFVFSSETAGIIVKACEIGPKWVNQITNGIRAVYDPSVGVRTTGRITKIKKLKEQLNIS